MSYWYILYIYVILVHSLYLCHIGTFSIFMSYWYILYMYVIFNFSQDKAVLEKVNSKPHVNCGLYCTNRNKILTCMFSSG